MQDKKQSLSYEEILDELQVQSWQLELVISGFAIFGLFSSLEPLQNLATASGFDGNSELAIFVYTIYITCALAIFNLIIHVLLRGLWIGAVGIRSVSGDIDFEKLNMSKVFKTHLKKKIGSFDKYIISLENYSSILFGVTFLIAFITIAVSLNFLIFVIIGEFIGENDFLPFEVKAVLGFILFPAFLLGHLITIIDFVIPGIVKRSQDVAKVYMPVYRVFSILTLSFIYRPILYNLLDNKFGKKIIYCLIPVYGILIFGFSLEMNPSNFFDNNKGSSIEFGHRRNYKDMLVPNKEFQKSTAIQSKTITDPFLHITIPYKKRTENYITEYDSLLNPDSDKRGYKSKISITFGNSNDTSVVKIEKYLQAINEMFQIQIDSTTIDNDLVLTTSEQDRFNLEMFVDLLDYSRGKHLLTIKRKELKTDSIATKEWVTIPFWYYYENAVTTTPATFENSVLDSIPK